MRIEKIEKRNEKYQGKENIFFNYWKSFENIGLESLKFLADWKENKSLENFKLAQQSQRIFKTRLLGNEYLELHAKRLKASLQFKKVFDYKIESWQSKCNGKFSKKGKNKLKLIYFDVETSCLQDCCWLRGKTGKIICWVAIADNGEVKHGHNSREFLLFIEEVSKKQRGKVYFWGHNALKFDTLFFLDKLLLKGGKKVGDYSIEYKNIKFLDSWNVYKTALENIAETEEERELKKKNQELFSNSEYHKEIKSRKFIGELVKYCENDTQILKNLVENLSSYKKGSFSSQALYLFRSKFIDYWNFKKYFPNFALEEFKEKREFVQKFFKGGLSDLWNEQKLEEGQSTWKADIVSAYPWIMSSQELPIGKGQWIRSRINHLNLKRGEIYDGTTGKLGFYLIKVNKFRLKEEFINQNIPPLLYVKNERGINIGTYEIKQGTELSLIGNELKFLMNYYETDFKILDGIVFRTKNGKEIFGEYVKELFTEKSKLKDLEEQEEENENWEYKKKYQVKSFYAKCLLNGLFGKFGQKTERWEKEWIDFGKLKTDEKGEKFLVVPEIEKKPWRLQKKVKFDKLNFSWNSKTKSWWGFSESRLKVVKGFNYVALSSAITAYCRIELNKAIIINKDKVLAYDTDGFILKGEPQDLKIGRGLGEWDLVGYSNKYPYIATNAKFLLGDGFKKTVGVPQDATFSFDSKGTKVNYSYWERNLKGIRIKKVVKNFFVSDYKKRELGKDNKWRAISF